MSTASGIERRQFGRKVTNIAAQAIAPGRAGVACTIRNISLGGARLQFSRPFTARGTFRLLADNNKLDVQCVIRHQDETGAGVEFVAITVQKLCVPEGTSEHSAPRYEAPAKPELVATKGLELRQKLFRAAAKPEPDVSPTPAAEPATVARTTEVAPVAPVATEIAPADHGANLKAAMTAFIFDVANPHAPPAVAATPVDAG